MNKQPLKRPCCEQLLQHPFLAEAEKAAAAAQKAAALEAKASPSRKNAAQQAAAAAEARKPAAKLPNQATGSLARTPRVASSSSNTRGAQSAGRAELASKADPSACRYGRPLLHVACRKEYTQAKCKLPRYILSCRSGKRINDVLCLGHHFVHCVILALVREATCDLQGYYPSHSSAATISSATAAALSGGAQTSPHGTPCSTQQPCFGRSPASHCAAIQCCTTAARDQQHASARQKKPERRRGYSRHRQQGTRQCATA